MVGCTHWSVSKLNHTDHTDLTHCPHCRLPLDGKIGGEISKGDACGLIVALESKYRSGLITVAELLTEGNKIMLLASHLLPPLDSMRAPSEVGKLLSAILRLGWIETVIEGERAAVRLTLARKVPKGYRAEVRPLDD